jgi:hypothetical protein
LLQKASEVQNLFRRGGVWWARLVVPKTLRAILGRYEFVQSCRTHELEIAKMVASVLLADWRQQIFRLQSRPMTSDVLKIVNGAPELTTGRWLALGDAVRLSGIEREHLLRAAADGLLRLFVRLARAEGYAVPLDSLEPLDPHAGPTGGLVIPQVGELPTTAIPVVQDGVLPLDESEVIAGTVLARRLASVSVVALELPGRPGWIFIPNEKKGLSIPLDQIHVLSSAVEAMRVELKATVTEDTLKRLMDIRTAAAMGGESSAKNSPLLFSKALDAYATDPGGIPGQVVSMTEQGQKRRGCNLFIELVGDLPLNEITHDKLREFRELLKGVPGKSNNIPKKFRREQISETVKALQNAGVKWPMLTEAARRERMLWLDQMFRWVVSQKWLKDNPMASVLGEQTKTAAERKTESQVRALRKDRGESDDSDDREPFAPEELQVVFSQDQYKSGNGAHVQGNARWYPFEFWLPLIALFAGCRIKEVSQLYLSDLRQVEDVWYFDINELTPDKSLKNENATRQIPVSPVLIELGLIEYAENLREAGYRRLFPELTWSVSDAKYAKESKRKMSQMFNELGMPRDGSKVFHCLRANFNNALLRVPFARLPFDDQDLKKYIRFKVVGHKVVGVNEEHYTNTTMRERLALVSGIEYGLPSIAKFDVDAGINAVQSGIKGKKGFRKGREDMGACNDAIYGDRK